MKTYYHITKRKNLNSIMKKGLLATRDYIFTGWEDIDKPGVNLIENVEDYPFPLKRGDVILGISVKDLNKKKLRYLGEGWLRYEGNISSKAISQIYTEEWLEAGELGYIEIRRK